VTTHLHPVLMLRMLGAIPPLSHTSSRHGILIKHRDFTFYINIINFFFQNIKYCLDHIYAFKPFNMLIQYSDYTSLGDQGLIADRGRDIYSLPLCLLCPD